MASRFWVGGAGTWDNSTTTHWSASSGGAGGASVPGTGDDVFLDGNSGVGAVTVSGGQICKSLTCTGFTGTLTGTATPQLQIWNGNLTLAAGMTLAGGIKWVPTTGVTITSAGKALSEISTVVGSATLGDALTVGTLTLGAGSPNTFFDAAGFAVTVTTAVNFSSPANFQLRMGSGTWTLSGTGNIWSMGADVSHLTITPSTSTIAITDTSAATKTFKGNGVAYSFSALPASGGNVALDLGATGSATLSGNLSSTTSLELVSGSFNAAGFAVTLAAFTADVGAVALTMGAVVWTLTGTGTVWDLSAAATMTLSAAGSTIAINDASAASKTFNGGSKSYGAIHLTGAGTGAFIILGSNSFTTFTLDTPPHTVQFQGGTTTTVVTFTGSGTAAAGDNILGSTTSAAWNLNCIAGITASYLSLSNSHVHGGIATASNSYDGGGNLGWNFVRSQSSAIYLDSAYQYTGAAISIVSGLTWLLGETLGVFADGVDIGDAVVDSHGNLTLPDGLTHSAITVGKRFMSRGVTLRTPQSGNQDGASLGRLMAIKSVAADMLNSSGLMVGTPAGVRPIPPAWKQTAAGNLYTGMFVAPVDDKYQNQGVTVFQTDRAYPCILRALEFEVESEP